MKRQRTQPIIWLCFFSFLEREATFTQYQNCFFVFGVKVEPEKEDFLIFFIRKEKRRKKKERKEKKRKEKKWQIEFGTFFRFLSPFDNLNFKNEKFLKFVSKFNRLFERLSKVSNICKLFVLSFSVYFFFFQPSGFVLKRYTIQKF